VPNTPVPLYVNMFKTVLRTYTFILLSYFAFIVAFAFCFHLVWTVEPCPLNPDNRWETELMTECAQLHFSFFSYCAFFLPHLHRGIHPLAVTVIFTVWWKFCSWTWFRKLFASKLLQFALAFQRPLHFVLLFCFAILHSFNSVSTGLANLSRTLARQGIWD
jgi:hypothetical protein